MVHFNVEEKQLHCRFFFAIFMETLNFYSYLRLCKTGINIRVRLFDICCYGNYSLSPNVML